MFTLAFWKATLERVLATFAETLLAMFTVGTTGLLDVDWPAALSVAGLAALAAVLKSLAASRVGNAGPSLANEVTSPPAPSISDDPGPARAPHWSGH